MEHRIGIIGSSHSTGKHRIKKNLKTETFIEKWIDYSPANWKFYSAAHGGKGSEHYVSCLMHLHKNYNIKTVLVELMVDRRNMNIDFARGENNVVTLEQTEEKFTDLIENSSSIQDIRKSMFDHCQLQMYQTFSREYNFRRLLSMGQFRKDIKGHINTSMLLQDIDILPTAWGFIHLHNVLEICEALNIKPILWAQYPCFECFDTLYKELIQDRTTVTFGKFHNARDYLKNKKVEKLYCDDVHFTDENERYIIQHFLQPAVQKYLSSQETFQQK